MNRLNRWTRRMWLACAAVACATPGWAHDDASLDAMKTAHGGQLRAAGAYHFELVVAPVGSQGDSLTVYVTDHGGKAVPTQGATGSATVLSGGRKTTIRLEPVAPNALRGRGDYVPAADLKAVVTLTLPGQPAAQARFTPLQAPSDPHAGHKH